MSVHSDVIYETEHPTVKDLSAVLSSDMQPARARAAAARALARITTPDATRALVAALRVTEPAVLRAVVESLALRGEGSALPQIEALASQAAVAESAAWAARLLRYQAGKDGDGLSPAAAMLNLDPDKALEMTSHTASAATLAEAAEMLSTSLPTFAPSRSDGLELACGDRRLLVILDRERVEEGLASRLVERRMLVGVVAEYWSLEDEGWEVAYLVLSEPRLGAGEARMTVVTTHGRLMYDGTAVARRETIAFALAAVAGPGNVPAEITGTIDHGRVRLNSAFVGTERSAPILL
ncbi:MAG TPA: HEAT repeat domain-containing protein [Vicinamibacterales bacterium]